jgi:hypothetical protein
MICTVTRTGRTACRVYTVPSVQARGCFSCELLSIPAAAAACTLCTQLMYTEHRHYQITQGKQGPAFNVQCESSFVNNIDDTGDHMTTV